MHAFGCRALLADEMGLGKSFQALYLVNKLPKSRPVLIVCPASLKWNWRVEARKHFGMPAEVLSGRTPPRHRRDHCPILIINYEILRAWEDYLVSIQPGIIIFDEAHYVSNRESQRFKALQFIMEESKCDKRIALSGTPLTNRPAELWAILRLLRPDLFKSYVEFGFKHCRPRLIHGRWVFSGAKNLPELHADLKKHVMVRRLKSDVASELPRKVRRVVVVDLPNRHEYIRARDNFISWLREQSPERARKAAKAQAMLKIGYLLRLVAKLKRFLVKEWIDNFLASSEGKLIVFSSHTKMVDWLMTHYSHQAVRIDGQVTGVKRHHAVEEFQHSLRKRLAICNPKAAGVGLNMIAASNVLYTDFPWAPGTLKQGEDRIHRIGQKEKCFVWLLAARDTAEEKLFELLQEKQKVLDAVLDGADNAIDFDIFNELIRSTTQPA